MLGFLQAKPAKPVETCRHISWTEHGEGVRSCPSCKIVQRLEKRRIPERGKEPWHYVTLQREDALTVLKDLLERQRS